DNAVAEVARRRRADADLDLPLALDLGAELELGAAAGDEEAGRAGRAGVLRERGGEFERNVEVTVADRRGRAVDVRLHAVDADGRVGAVALAVDERPGDRLDADEVLRPEVGRVEIEL